MEDFAVPPEGAARGAQPQPEVPVVELSPAGDPAPPGEIALCLSGGGYRAAAFHLGVLDLLHQSGLLPRVQTLSTISGGTIAGAPFALSQSKGEPFDTYRDRLYRALRDRNVVAEACRGLHPQKSGAGQLSLIRTAAQVYADEGFVGAARFGELMDASLGPAQTVFSATEFVSGLAYRFQTSRHSTPHIGNVAPLEIPVEVARDIRLADVIAASSCFPAAFEPLTFPDDFTWTEPLPRVRAKLGKDFASLPLMDGGIFDNQGVDGAKAVYERAGMLNRLGLLLVSDTSQRQEPLLPPAPAGRSGGLSLRAWLGAGAFVFALSLASSAGLLAEMLRADLAALDPWYLIMRFVVPLLLALGAAGGLAWAFRFFHTQKRKLEIDTSVALWPAIQRLSAGEVVDLLERRFRSLVAVSSQVSMKRIRRMIQDATFSDPRYRQRAAFCLIYDLDRNRPNLHFRLPWLQPSPVLRELARRAEQVPTTLWMTRESALRDLVACGQATACATLLEHLHKRLSTSPSGLDPESARAEAVLRLLWERLKTEPHALLWH